MGIICNSIENYYKQCTWTIGALDAEAVRAFPRLVLLVLVDSGLSEESSLEELVRALDAIKDLGNRAAESCLRNGECRREMVSIQDRMDETRRLAEERDVQALTRPEGPFHNACSSAASAADEVGRSSDDMTLTDGDGQKATYTLGRKVGEGAFGVVYEGTDLSSQAQVAVKFVGDTLLQPLVLNDNSNSWNMTPGATELQGTSAGERVADI